MSDNASNPSCPWRQRSASHLERRLLNNLLGARVVSERRLANRELRLRKCVRRFNKRAGELAAMSSATKLRTRARSAPPATIGGRQLISRKFVGPRAKRMRSLSPAHEHLSPELRPVWVLGVASASP